MVMRLDNSFKIAYQRHYVFCASFCTPYFFFFFFSLELYKEKHYRSPFGFIDFIFSYKNCIMKYTFRYSVVHWVLFYKTYSKKYKNIYIHIYINQLIWLYKKDSLPILVTLLYCTPGNVGLASLWRRKASHQHWRDVYCCSPGLISKLSLCSLHTDCPMCCVSWTSATRVQSSCSLCTQTEHVTMIQAILLRERKKRKEISIKVVSKIWLQLLWSENGQDRWWRTGLHFLLADVAYEIFTGEIVP